MNKILTEGFDYKDLVGVMMPTISVDEYAANMGDDDEIVTLAFTVKGQQASDDLTDWFERGYDFVLDSEVSEGQVSKGKYLVFVEMNRRNAVPDRIIELIEDLQTLTQLPLEDWVITVGDKEYKADAEVLKSVIILSPHQYRLSKESDLNEMRNRAGLEPQKIFREQDSLLKDFISKAGL
jgi:hypothetical protein